MLEFVLWVFLVSLAVKFLRTLMEKWGIREWLQVNAPCDLLHEMLMCDFCLSLWMGLAISVFLAIFVHWWMLFIPVFSCNLRYD